MRLALLDPLADLDDRALVDARALVGAHELVERYSSSSFAALLGLDQDPIRGDATGPTPRALGDDDLAGVERGRPSMPVPTIGASGSSSGTAWRCMFEPISARLASSCSRNGISAVATLDDLLGRDVHVVDLVRAAPRERVAEARRDALVDEVTLGVERGVGLRDVMLLFLVGGEIDDLVGHARA